MAERVPELLPCPFCGGPARLSRHPKGYYLAHCADETCDPGHLTFARAEDWNRRAHADAEKAEAVREALNGAATEFEGKAHDARSNVNRMLLNSAAARLRALADEVKP